MSIKPPPGTTLSYGKRSAGLTAFWPMNEGGGLVLNDVSRRPHTFSLGEAGDHSIDLTNNPTWKTSPWGPALSLNDAASQYGTVRNGAGGHTINLLTTKFRGTILASIYLTADINAFGAYPYRRPGILAETGGFYGLHVSNVSAGVNEVIAYVNDNILGAKIATFQITGFNRWVDVAYRYDEANIQIYRDGLLQMSTACTNPSGTGTPSGYYVGTANALFNYLPARIGYIATYDRALSAAEIMQWHIDPFGDLFQRRRSPARMAGTATAITDLRWAPDYPDKVPHPRFRASDQQYEIHGLYPGGTLFETQAPVESQESPTLIHARVTQEPLEGLEQQSSPEINLRLSQMVVEVLIPFSCAITPAVPACPEKEPPPVTGDPGCAIPFDPTGV